jgi:hypothetical protein
LTTGSSDSGKGGNSSKVAGAVVGVIIGCIVVTVIAVVITKRRYAKKCGNESAPAVTHEVNNNYAEIQTSNANEYDSIGDDTQQNTYEKPIPKYDNRSSSSPYTELEFQHQQQYDEPTYEPSPMYTPADIIHPYENFRP